jgi:hypothetical protein
MAAARYNAMLEQQNIFLSLGLPSERLELGIVIFAEAHWGRPVAPASYYQLGYRKGGDETCTDLVVAAFLYAGALVPYNGNLSVATDYVWSQLKALTVTGTGGNGSPRMLYGQFAAVRHGDILQFNNAVIDGAKSVQHSAIIEANLGSGLFRVLEQNNNGRHYVTRGFYNLSHLTAGTVNAYHPVRM